MGLFENAIDIGETLVGAGLDSLVAGVLAEAPILAPAGAIVSEMGHKGIKAIGDKLKYVRPHGPRTGNIHKQEGKTLTTLTKSDVKKIATHAAHMGMSNGTDAFVSAMTRGAMVVERKGVIIDELTLSTDAFGSAPIAEIHLNPGIHSAFPFLFTIAGRYSQYVLTHCEFTFEPFVSGLRDGAVAMGVTYGSSHTRPSSLLDFSALTTNVVGSVRNSHSIRLDCDLGMTGLATKFVREDTRRFKSLYDIGHLYVSCFGGDSQVVAGVLKVSYRFILYGPRLMTLGSQSLFTNYTSWATTNTITDNDGAGRDFQLTTYTTSPDDIETNTVAAGTLLAGETLLFPPGIYLLDICAELTFTGTASTGVSCRIQPVYGGSPIACTRLLGYNLHYAENTALTSTLNPVTVSMKWLIHAPRRDTGGLELPISNMTDASVLGIRATNTSGGPSVTPMTAKCTLMITPA